MTFLAKKKKKVDIAKLGSDNYTLWSAQMESVLVIKGLWGAVDGADVVSADTDKKAWAHMILCVQPEHVGTIQRAESAREAWTTLRNIYQAQSTARQMLLKRELTHLAKSPTES